MALAAEDIKKIAQLARLKVSEQQLPGLHKDLGNILNLVEQMNTVDTDKVEPLAHPFDEKQLLRDDVVTEQDQHEKFQQLASLTEQQLYLVPKVISNE